MTTKVFDLLSAANVHSHCLLCGDLNQKSLKLSFDVSGDGMVETHFTPNHELQGYDGILHGGVIAAFLDAAMTHCLFHHGIQALTGELHVRFMRPIPCGVSISIRAWILSRRASLYRLKSDICIEGQTMAWAKSVFMKRKESLL